MKKLFIISCFSLISFCSISQLTFQKTFGGIGDDWGRGIINTSDGGYAIVGTTNSYGAGSNDFYVVKFDVLDSIQWVKTIGGTGSEVAGSLIQTVDGGYAIVGSTTSSGAGNTDVYLVKLDSVGVLQWTRTFGGTFSETGNSLVQATDGGYTIAGYTNSFGAGGYDVYVIKTDATGALQWAYTIGGTSNEQGNSITKTNDGGYVIAGNTESYSSAFQSVYILKLDATGILQWTRTIEGTGGGDAYGSAGAIIQSSDGSYVTAGYLTYAQSGYGSVYVIKLNISGNLQWARTIGAGKEGALSLVQSSDGGYVVVGNTVSFGAGYEDVYVVKLSASGALQWTRAMGGTGTDQGYSIIQTNDGGYSVVGYTNSGNPLYYFDIILIKLDSSGNTCSNTGIGGAIGNDGIMGITGGIMGSGGTTGSGGIISSGGVLTTVCSTIGTNEIALKDSIIIYPNPSNGEIGIYNLQNTNNDFDLYNVFGDKVYTEKISNLTSYIIHPDLPAGIYLLQIRSEKEIVINQKIIIN